MNDKITVRPIELTDAEAVERYAADARVAETTNIPHPYPANGGQEFVKRAVAGRETGQRYAFAILYEGELVGTIGINAVDKDAGTAELDYCVASPFWHKGIGSEAAGQAIEYAFEQLGLSALFSSCLKENVASARVLDKNGFAQIGEFTNAGEFGTKFLGRAMVRFRLKRDEKLRSDRHRQHQAMHPTAYSPLVPRSLPAAGELDRSVAASYFTFTHEHAYGR